MSYTQRGTPVRTQAATGANREIQCKCTPPRNAIRLQTRKEGPNLDRYFYKCDGSHCNFFQWEDELKAQQPSSTPARGGNLPASSNGNRLGSAPTRVPPVTPSKPKNPRKRRASSEDVELEASLGSSSAQADLDDDDADDVIEFVGDEPKTPSKQARLTSSSTPSASDRRKTTGGAAYDAIMSDPTSPFHARHASLFGSTLPGSSVPGPSPGVGGVPGIVATLATVGPMLEDLQREIEKKDRLIKAGDKRSEVLQKKLQEKDQEYETLRTKAHHQSLEITELRTRINVLEH